MSARREWLGLLTDADISFMRSFVLRSGSLKQLAQTYGVSYPTIRSRLNKLIAKIEVYESIEDPFIVQIRALALEQNISSDIISKISEIYDKEKDAK